MRQRACSFVFALLLIAAPARGQEVRVLLAEQARIRMRNGSQVEGLAVDNSNRRVALLLGARDSLRVPWDSISRVSQLLTPPRLYHVKRGFVYGAVAGAVIGTVVGLQDRGCGPNSDCMISDRQATVLLAGLCAIPGGVAGSLISVVLPPRPEWIRVFPYAVAER